MKSLRVFAPLLVGAALLASVAVQPGRAESVDKKIELFNGKNLDNWYTFLPSKGKNSDPEKIFTVHDGMIHITGKEFGYIATNNDYENYRLVIEFKWGEKKFPPRENAVRDSGVLMHMVGDDKVWPKSVECQIQEGDTGDFWLIGGATIEVDGQLINGHKKKKVDAEKPTGQWNTVEVICEGDKVTHIVNGVTNNVGVKSSLTKGKIVFQSEGAEVYYRKIELHPLKK